MEDTTVNVEQQQNLLASSVQTKRSKSKNRLSQTVYRAITEHYWPILLLLVVIMIGIGAVAYFPRLKSNETEDGIVLKQGTSFNQDRQDANQRNPMQMNFERPKPPEALGRVALYIRKPSSDDDDDRKPPLRVYVPAARYHVRRFPLKGPFLNFMPSTPIFANRATQETIIYSSIRGYILPALVDGHGQLYSIARLIATGYASFTEEEMHSSKSIDMNTYFESSAVPGARIPKIDTRRGGFSSGLRVNINSFDIYGEEDMNDDSEEYNEEDNDKNNKHRHTYDKPRHRNSKDDSSETTITSTKKTMSASTSTKKSVPHHSHADVNFTLIIEYIFPYPQSTKPVIGVNGTSPGPTIDVCENDTVIIRVINKLDVPSAIHWHGVRQLGTPDMDGAVGLSQCAIPPGHEMIYKFQATPAGTTWYHGHLLEQYTDGLFGPLIIRRCPVETYSDLYQSEQILTIADWYNIPAHTGLIPWHYSPLNPVGFPPPPDAIVVNGKFTEHLYIPVNGAEVIRFRIISAAALSMFTVSIDGCRLSIIEVDTTTTIPYPVDSFTLNVAQRCSFLCNLTDLDPTYNASSVKSVYIRIQATLSVYPQDVTNFIPPYENQSYPYPTFYNPLYLAFLSLDSTNSTPTYAASSATPILSNVTPPLDTNILDARPLFRNANGVPNATHYLAIAVGFGVGPSGFGDATVNGVSYSSDANYMHMRPDPPTGFTSDLYEPLLYQMVRKPNQLAISSPLLEAGNDLPVIQSDANGHYLIPYLACVDIYITNPIGGEHPFHLHGHNFWIVSTSDYPEAEFLYADDYTQRDTVSVPGGGWAKIRFVADNPGAWFMHCHIEFHMAIGLAVALIVSPDQLLTNGYTIPQSGQKQCEALQRFNTTYDPVIPSN
ncbi:unnamed protein product [Adineta steineri]|uniref:Multicopper oxidase n=1 Tax=Adineta steineri TaxID=433720 RepID=A0A816BPK9_9BILA|nr:unnamed protein product [Adineta steineri]CAF1611809.1 unnamed protein product [Adineta steineri]